MAAPSDRELWAAVADPSRRLLLDALVETGEATATTLAASVPFTRQAVTKHLAVLADAGLVEPRRAGREVRYVVRPDGLEAATRAMARVAERWERRLGAIKEAAEEQHRQGAGERPADTA